MKFSTLVSIAFWPFKGLNYFEHYYKLTKEICLHRNKKLILTVKLFNLLVGLKAVHFLLISLQCTDQLCDEHNTLLHFDALYLLLGRSLINLISFFVASLVVYYNCHLVLLPDLVLIDKIKQIILDNK